MKVDAKGFSIQKVIIGTAKFNKQNLPLGTCFAV